MIPVVVIQGPTGVGKSSLAMRLAEELQTEIISADSRQVYKFLDIGTAKPTADEQKKIKHHLIDFITPDLEYSAGVFAKDASGIIADLHKKGKLPLVCGGTMFYAKALTDGLFQSQEVPPEYRQKLKQEAAEKGSEFLHARLAAVDPESAVRANPNDLSRIIRALEVYEYTGKSITQLWKEFPPKQSRNAFLNILLTDERQLLYERINRRVDLMMQQGLIEEFQSVLRMGYDFHHPGLNTVGYRELFPWQKHERNLEDCVNEIKQHSRNYAKRQITWYRNTVFDLTFSISEIDFHQILERIERFRSEIEGEK